MEGSSDSAWQNSNSSRNLNSSGVLDREPSHVKNVRGLSDVSQDILTGVCENEPSIDPFVRTLEFGDVSLRQWLDKPKRVVDVYECLHIFRQIVEIVNVAHSQGIVVHNVRPSCFIMSSFNNVSFIESASCSDSGSDEEGLNGQSQSQSENAKVSSGRTNVLSSEVSCMQSGSVYGTHFASGEGNQEIRVVDRTSSEQVEEKKQPFPMKQILLMETNWYTSPEENAGASVSCASDVYRLGVLLFEVCNVNPPFFSILALILFFIVFISHIVLVT